MLLYCTYPTTKLRYVTSRQKVVIIKFWFGAKEFSTQPTNKINNFKRFNPCWET
jgi:hypothetical protein